MRCYALRRFQEGLLKYDWESSSCILKFFISSINSYSFVSYKPLDGDILPWFFPVFIDGSFISFLPREAVHFVSEDTGWPSMNKSWESMLYIESADKVELRFFDLDATRYIYSKFPVLLYNLLFLFPKKRLKLITKFISQLNYINSDLFMFFTCFDKEDLYEI